MFQTMHDNSFRTNYPNSNTTSERERERGRNAAGMVTTSAFFFMNSFEIRNNAN